MHSRFYFSLLFPIASMPWDIHGPTSPKATLIPLELGLDFLDSLSQQRLRDLT